MYTNKPFYTIGELSSICGIPQKTLRYYDEIGLLSPERRDERTHYRYYSKSQVITLFTIKTLKKMGFSLKEIRGIIENNSAESLEKEMQKRLNSMKWEIEKQIDQYTECRCLLQKIQRGTSILEISSNISSEDLEISIEQIPPITLFYDREVMKNYDYTQISLGRWFSILDRAENSEYHVTGPVHVTFYEEKNILDRFLGQDSLIEFAVQIEKTDPAENIRKFGGFEAATMIHIGSYDDIPNSYIQVIKWINQNHYRICGPPTEEFILSPLDVNDETRRVTKIIIPISR